MSEVESKGAKRKRILDELYELEEDDYVDVLCKSLPDLSRQKLSKIKNFISNKRLMLNRGDTMDEGNSLISPPRVSRPAWEIDLIFRGDLVPKQGMVFMDVEKVNLKGSHRLVAGTVAIVDARRELILWCIIKQDNVCQYFPKITGLDPAKISSGITFPQAKTLIKKILAGNTVVGSAIGGDLASIDYDPKMNNTSILEIQDFFRDSKGQAFSLADLVKHFFPEKKDYQCCKHAAISDARMTVRVAKRMLDLKKKNFKSYDKVKRSEKPKKLDVGDKCSCSTTKKKYKNKPAGRQDWRDFDYNI